LRLTRGRWGLPGDHRHGGHGRRARRPAGPL